VDGLGNIYVTGASVGSVTSSDYATIKYDPNGNELWVKRYNGPGNGYDSASALAVDDLGNVYVTGYSYGNSSSTDYATIKYDPNGNELWVKRYNGPGNGYDSATALAVDDLGNVYVTGYSYGNSSSTDYATVKYDTNGNRLWVKRYNGYPSALVVDDLGNVYVTGYTSRDYATIKYSQRNYCAAVLDGDLDGNCKVDFFDYAMFAKDWLIGSDLNDLAELANNWLECNLAYQGGCW
jgi:hypothetical protein